MSVRFSTLLDKKRARRFVYVNSVKRALGWVGDPLKFSAIPPAACGAQLFSRKMFAAVAMCRSTNWKMRYIRGDDYERWCGSCDIEKTAAPFASEPRMEAHRCPREEKIDFFPFHFRRSLRMTNIFFFVRDA